MERQKTAYPHSGTQTAALHGMDGIDKAYTSKPKDRQKLRSMTIKPTVNHKLAMWH